MATFNYTACDEHGSVTRGVSTAVDVYELRSTLDLRGLALVDARKVRELFPLSAKRHGPASRELAECLRYVALCTKAGLPLIQTLEDHAEQTPSKELATTLRHIVADVREGVSLSDAFARHPRQFDESLVHMIRAGELSGAVDIVLGRIAKQIEFQREIRASVVQALVYPAVVGTAVLGLVILLLTFVLPRLVGVMAKSGAKLPPITQALVDVSDFIIAHWPWLVGGLAAFAASFRFALAFPTFHLLASRVALSTPILSTVLNMSANARFSAALRTMLASGVEAVRSVRTAGEASGSSWFAERTRAASETIREGHTLSEALQPVSELHPLVRRMIQLGESTGQPDEALDTAITYFETEIPARVRRALSLLEPLMIGAAGLVCGTIVIAAVLPIFSLYDAIK